jgi:uncharacterized protein (TIGR02300 family)
MAKADLGTKRTCLNCGMRFFDFNRSPILCPGCGEKFDPDSIVKTRKGKSKSSIAASPAAHDQNDADAKDDDLIEPVTADDSDDGIDFDDSIDDVDDDGPGIIQDDITNGEELLPDIDSKDEN